MYRLFRIVSGIAFVIPFTCSIAHATLLCLPPLAPGGVESPNFDDTCPADHNGTNPIGNLVDDTGIQAFSLTGSGITTTGSLREVVYMESAGTLDFYIQLQVASGNPFAAVNDVNTGNFANFFTEVGTLSAIQLLSSTGTASPSIDTRSAGGDTIQWSYLTGIPGGTTSFTMAISTDATRDAISNIGLIGAGGGTETLDGFEPLAGSGKASLPEPVSVVLLGTVLAGSAFILRRRKRQP